MKLLIGWGIILTSIKLPGKGRCMVCWFLGLQSPGIPRSHSFWMSKSEDHGPWGSFGICFFSPFSSLHCSTHLDTESRNEAWSPPEGKWQGWGVGNNQGTSAHLDPSLATGLPFYVFLYHPCPWCKGPVEQEFVLWVLFTGVLRAFCPCILNLSLSETQVNT